MIGGAHRTQRMMIAESSGMEPTHVSASARMFDGTPGVGVPLRWLLCAWYAMNRRSSSAWLRKLRSCCAASDSSSCARLSSKAAGAGNRKA